MQNIHALMQEIDTLPPDSINEVSTFVSFLKYKAKASDNTNACLNDFDNLLNTIHAAADEPMPPIEPIQLREVDA